MQRIIPPPGYDKEAPRPSPDDLLMAKNISLSNFWEHYAVLLEKSDWEKSEIKAKAAYSKAAGYLRQAIEIAEKSIQEDWDALGKGSV